MVLSSFVVPWRILCTLLFAVDIMDVMVVSLVPEDDEESLSAPAAFAKALIGPVGVVASPVPEAEGSLSSFTGGIFLSFTRGRRDNRR